MPEKKNTNQLTDLGTSVEGSRHQEVVLAEPHRTVAAEIVLREDGEHECSENRAVYAYAQIPNGPCS